MLTEECHLNPYLEQHGLEVVDTDLGERIVQLRNEPPSHIVLPAIHIKKQEVGETFHEHLGTEEGATDPDVSDRGGTRSFARASSWRLRRASRASILPWRKPAALSSAPTKGMRTSVSRCPSCTSPAWGSRN